MITLPAFGQANVDASLLAEIQKIRAVDNHSHISPFQHLAADAKVPDDPMGAPPFPYPARLRVDNPEWTKSWKALYGTAASQTSAASARDALRAKHALMRREGEKYPSWVLDKAGIDIAFVNMPSPGTGLPASRFRWVPTANALLFPFGGTETDAVFTPPSTPATSLEAWNRDVVIPTLQRWRREGAVAVKLSLAYQRPLDFEPLTAEDGAELYENISRIPGPPPAREYRSLQDHLFMVLGHEAAKLNLAVHIHVGIGADPYFAIRGADPLLLESAINHPSLRATNFVLVHGGWPFDREAGVMLIKPNVYADFSAQTFLRSPRALSETLRAWLEWYPEKVLFGTDAYPDPNTPTRDWDSMLWLANDSARTALAMALTGMMNDGLISRSRALELARMVLRENAIKLYGLRTSSRASEEIQEAAPGVGSGARGHNDEVALASRAPSR